MDESTVSKDQPPLPQDAPDPAIDIDIEPEPTSELEDVNANANANVANYDYPFPHKWVDICVILFVRARRVANLPVRVIWSYFCAGFLCLDLRPTVLFTGT